ncbi:MAG: DUF1320 domain-containing protein [Magnetococcales bacterium]|nr:DUF1320 domain-containing protein [Magnetococcales bacterium]
MYCTPAQLATWFGADELGQACSTTTPVDGGLMQLTIDGRDRSGYTPEQIDAADQVLARIEASIETGFFFINTYLRSRYQLPLDQAAIDQSPLPRICGDLARHSFHDDLPTSEIGERRKAAISYLKDLQSGKAILSDSATQTTTPTGSPQVVQGGVEAQFSTTQISGF